MDFSLQSNFSFMLPKMNVGCRQSSLLRYYLDYGQTRTQQLCLHNGIQWKRNLDCHRSAFNCSSLRMVGVESVWFWMWMTLNPKIFIWSEQRSMRVCHREHETFLHSNWGDGEKGRFDSLLYRFCDCAVSHF